MVLNELKVGDTAFLERWGYRGKSFDLIEVKVSKVGRKYIHVGRDKYSIEDGLYYDPDYFATARIWASKEEFKKRQLKNTKISELKDAFRRHENNLDKLPEETFNALYDLLVRTLGTHSKK